MIFVTVDNVVFRIIKNFFTDTGTLLVNIFLKYIVREGPTVYQWYRNTYIFGSENVTHSRSKPYFIVILVAKLHLDDYKNTQFNNPNIKQGVPPKI